MKKLLLLSLTLAITLGSSAQKRALEWSDIQSWNRITSQLISDDGKYIVVETTPWVGDSAVSIFSSDAKQIKTFEQASKPSIISRNFVVGTISPTKATIDSLKLLKEKNLPKNQLAIFDIKKGAETLIDSLVDIKVSSESKEWLAYRTGKNNDLTITNFSDTEVTFDNVVEYNFSQEDDYLILSRYAKDSLSQLIIFDLAKGVIASQTDLDSSKKAQKLSVSNKGKAAYITVGEDKSGSENEIFYFDGQVSNKIAISSLQKEWIVNENFKPRFAENKDRLYFGISPKYPVADTTILESNKAKVEVWKWNEPKLKTQQVVDYDQDIKHAYAVIYDINSATTSQISTLETPDYQLLSKSGDSDLALIETIVPYQMESMWTGGRRRDVYLKNIVSGDQTEILKGVNTTVRVSPDAQYLYWYTAQDSTWNAYSVADARYIKMVTPADFAAYNITRNVPDLPVAYGVAGWSEDDKMVYIYDKHDIWAVDPMAKISPKRVTNGYKENITYRVARLERAQEEFETDEKLLLQMFNNDSKQSGFASVAINKPSSFKQLISGPYRYIAAGKASDSKEFIFTRECFEEFPNIYATDIDFKGKVLAITDVNPQQSEFIWGTVEPITWVSLDGDTLQGNLVKPENFDPNKQYPMICNFYERDSDNLYSYKMPEVHRSAIDYHYYSSNGYVIFNPDIKYVDGYPGESCFNSLMPGVSKILEMGFVDPARVGAQGHSWGGYQTAYLATRTDMFAALESGAPVVNMISAYGGIRWASGLNRAFQYEHGQSRIGASPWEAPARYTENSPIYTMDKVNTPILIMHNDQDGHVPWWQGIEFFVALRRLEKPAWLLNYNGEPHWPTTAPNKLDFQTKMSQYFDHYLKGAEMPDWMK